MLSIGAIIPLLTLINESSNNSDIINFISNYFLSDYSQSEKLIYFSLSIFVFFLIKNIFTIINTKIISNYLLFFSAELQQKLFEKFINTDYNKLQERNSEKYIRDITIETRLIVTSYLSPIFQIIINTLTVFFFIVLLLVYDFLNTIIIVSILFVLSLIIVFVLKPIIYKFGLIRQDSTGKIIGYIKQTFDGIRELKIDNLQKFYFKDFKKNIEKLASTGVQRAIFGILPRIIFETIIVLFFVAFIIFSIQTSADLTHAITTLTIFGASALRIVPSITNAIRSYQRVNYSKSALETVKEILREKEDKKYLIKKSNEILTFNQEFELRNINFKYKDIQIFNDLNLKILKNNFYGLKGQTGAGKSTLVDIICGLLKPDKGEFLVDGKQINSFDHNWMNKISYIQQNPYIFNLSLAQNISLNKDIKSIDFNKIKELITLVGLGDFVNQLENNLHSMLLDKGTNLSGGQKQKISIARALYKNKEILIFDESLSNLDKKNKMEILNILENFKNKKTIIMISHDDECLKNADKIIQLQNKKISYEI